MRDKKLVYMLCCFIVPGSAAGISRLVKYKYAEPSVRSTYPQFFEQPVLTETA